MIRLIKSIWLRLTFQFSFRYKEDKELTNLIKMVLRIGVKGFLKINEGDKDQRINILLKNGNVLQVKDNGRFHEWMSSGFLGTKNGPIGNWENARPHIIEMAALVKTLNKFSPIKK